MQDITKHGQKRLRKRLGASKSSAQKRADEAFLNGQLPKEFSGRFRHYLDRISIEHKTTPIIYKGNIFIFNPRHHILITCWPVESKYRKYLKNE